MNIVEKIATALNAKNHQVVAAIGLLDEGSTVPFIARYRKEVTGGLDDTQLRELETLLQYLRTLDERRETILNSIREQNKLTPELEQAIVETDNKATLEDLYLPYKPKRRTKAQIARESGLEPLAQSLLQDSNLIPEAAAEQYINAEKNVNNVAEALEGARQILMEQWSENAELLAFLRQYLWEQATLTSQVVKEKEQEGQKFSDYFNYQEPVKKVPSHRALALFRGRQEDILRIQLILTDEQQDFCKQKIASQFALNITNTPAAKWLFETVTWTWKIKLFIKLEVELLLQLKEQADAEAIKVFAKNLHGLLMAAPAGSRVTMGLDPGLRTGVKVVVVDGTGKLLVHTTVFPHAPRNEWSESVALLAKICQQCKVDLISIGNGTASRETDKLVAELKNRHPELKLSSIVVSEAGASVYSASELAAKEFPALDVSYRGAVSIARRLQDPLAELIKIDPKSIGVGQYQHDVNQTQLANTLHAVMEDCVNAVGVNVNTASVPLLACVAGLNETVAKNIISYRDEHGPFKTREALKKVPRFGDKTFEQAAGFIRIPDGDNPLDASAVHPEAYPVVQKILQALHKDLKEVMGSKSVTGAIKPSEYIDEHFGLPTVIDIIHELEKPGRDPRPEFKTATFQEGIETLADLKPGMILEGVITNVANFGAFVDIGVHQDGLVHVSALANHFVKDPHTVVKVGNVVKVKVLEIDLHRKRIQLSMRLDEEAAPKKMEYSNQARDAKSSLKKSPKITKIQQADTLLGDALRAALKKE